MLATDLQEVLGQSSPAEIRILNRNSLLKRINRSKYLLVLLIPCIIYYIIFSYVPMWGVLIAFKNYKVYTGFAGSDWVGIKYFRLFFSSPDMFELLRNTFLLGLYSLLWGFPFPLIFALVLNEAKPLKFKKAVQTISYIPHFLSTVVVVGLVQLFLSPTFGFVNKIIEDLGFARIVFLQNPEYFRTIFISTGIWQNIGWGAIVYIAALSRIDPNLYEAAMIDGANRFKKLIYITLPCISPTIITLFLLATGEILGVGFEKAYLLQNDAILSTADVIQTYVWRQGLQRGNFSYATAVGLFNSVVNLFFLVLSNTLARRYSETSLW